MSDQRKPLVGFTAEYLPEGSIRVFAPSGKVWGICDDPDEWGIPAPPPPRTGTLGLTEEDTREYASVSPIETPARHLSGRIWNATIRMCRADVARWDAEDEAARNAVPETLWVELPTEAMGRAARWWSGRDLGTATVIGDACRAAIEKAGLA